MTMPSRVSGDVLELDAYELGPAEGAGEPAGEQRAIAQARRGPLPRAGGVGEFLFEVGLSRRRGVDWFREHLLSKPILATSEGCFLCVVAAWLHRFAVEERTVWPSSRGV